MMDWISLGRINALGVATSHALFIMASVGVVLGLLRWKQAEHRDLLLAYILALLGTAIIQIPTYMASGMVGWGRDQIMIATFGRVLQNVATILFIRGVLRDRYGPWVWRTIALAVVAVSLV